MTIQVAVLMGGLSSERDVSFHTGKAMVSACQSLGYKTVPVEFSRDIFNHLDTLKNADIVLIALHGGIGENGNIQGMFESLGIRYTGSDALSSAMCMDKHISKLLAEDIGVATPGWQQIRRGQSLEIPSLTFPVVVKPNSEGSTIGLTIVHKTEELSAAVETAFQYDDELLVEDYIPGKEITVSVLGNTLLPIIEIRPTHEVYDYECKYQQGMTDYICPADLPDGLTESIQATALEMYSLLKCRHYGRVDFRLDENNKHWFLEINTLPGMTNTSLVPKAAMAHGLSFTQIIEKIIKQALD